MDERRESKCGEAADTKPVSAADTFIHFTCFLVLGAGGGRMRINNIVCNTYIMKKKMHETVSTR
jgi:hypothetical protein